MYMYIKYITQMIVWTKRRMFVMFVWRYRASLLVAARRSNITRQPDTDLLHTELFSTHIQVTQYVLWKW